MNDSSQRSPAPATSNLRGFARGVIRGSAESNEVRIEGPVTTIRGKKGLSIARGTAKALGEWLLALSAEPSASETKSDCEHRLYAIECGGWVEEVGCEKCGVKLVGKVPGVTGRPELKASEKPHANEG